MEEDHIPEETARESLQEFLSDTYEGGDWDPLINYINQHYISKRILRKGLEKAPPKGLTLEEQFANTIDFTIRLLGELYEMTEEPEND